MYYIEQMQFDKNKLWPSSIRTTLEFPSTGIREVLHHFDPHTQLSSRIVFQIWGTCSRHARYHDRCICLLHLFVSLLTYYSLRQSVGVSLVYSCPSYLLYDSNGIALTATFFFLMDLFTVWSRVDLLGTTQLRCPLELKGRTLNARIIRGWSTAPEIRSGENAGRS